MIRCRCPAGSDFPGRLAVYRETTERYFETPTYSEFFNVLRLLRAILPGPSRDWEPDFTVRTRRLIDGSLQSGRLMKRRLPDGTVEYRAMTEAEHREAAADDAW